MKLSAKKRCHQCFSVLADETRMRILKGLQLGSANVTKITEDIGLTQPTVSHHLKLLADGEFILRRKNGRETHYVFNRDYPCKGCGVFTSSIKS